MSYAEKRLIESYTSLLGGLSPAIKKKIIERLTNSLAVDKSAKDAKFYASFGAFSDEKTAEEIASDLKASRTFSSRDIKF
jgi:hypothetical protein